MKLRKKNSTMIVAHFPQNIYRNFTFFDFLLECQESAHFMFPFLTQTQKACAHSSIYRNQNHYDKREMILFSAYAVTKNPKPDGFGFLLPFDSKVKNQRLENSGAWKVSMCCLGLFFVLCLKTAEISGFRCIYSKNQCGTIDHKNCICILLVPCGRHPRTAHGNE